MAYRIRYLPRAWRDLARLPLDVARRVRPAIERLAEEPRVGKPLQGPLAPFWSLRTGDYRIIYEIRGGELLILIVHIGHRRDIYERVRRG
jgi:mRNA interferase RelE/StbE